MSSKYGLLREGTGTPTGGLILHALVSCIFAAAVPLLPNSLEGFIFIINTYTYGHTILNLTLASGVLLPILVHRMNANSTATADNALLYGSKPTWSWQILKLGPARWLCAGFLVLVNSFLAFLPFIPSKNTDGSLRKIPTWKIPVTVLLVYAAGAVAGFFIVFISTTMDFLNTRVVEGSVTHSDFVYPVNRRWKIEYPKVKHALRYNSPPCTFQPNYLHPSFDILNVEKQISLILISPLTARYLLAIHP